MFYIVNVEFDQEFSDTDHIQLLVYAGSPSKAIEVVSKNVSHAYKFSVEQVGDGIMNGLPFIHLPENENYILSLHEENSTSY